MTREPSFNAPTSEHTLLHLQETLDRALTKAAAGNFQTRETAKSLAIAFDMHTRQLIKEQGK